MQDAIICDLDGCLFYTDWIFEEIEEQGLIGAAKWDYFHRHVNHPKSCMCPELKNFIKEVLTEGIFVIFMTARSEVIANETKSRLLKEFPRLTTENHLIMMRPYNDYDDADLVKERMLQQLKKENKYSFIMAIDDEPKNIEMFARNQITAKQWRINNPNPEVKWKEKNRHGNLITSNNSH